jgi:hypothetical protein
MNDTIEIILIGIGFSIAIVILACWKVNDKYKQYNEED